MTRDFDPHRLDVTAFTEAQATLSGAWPLERLARLDGSGQPAAARSAAPVTWQVTGECRRVTAGPSERRLLIRADTTVWLTCQRCLEPMATPLQVDTRVRFVRGEDEAEKLDEQGEEDVMALPRQLDLAELIEDELILALPLVPMHAACSVPAGAGQPAGGEAGHDDPPPPEHPFAALAGWRKRPAGEQG